MAYNALTEKAGEYLRRLCLDIPNRRVGSPGNRDATDFFESIVASYDFETETMPFECIDWNLEDVRLSVNDTSYEVYASPYSLGCHVSAPLALVSADDELETAELTNKIVLLRGDITREQLMPKNFPFYNPDRHKRIIHLLEIKEPKAILTATSRDEEMVGGAVYPFPLFEDGDFDIPSAYMTEEKGRKLAKHVGKGISLEIKAKRIPAIGCNVIARKGTHPHRRVVLFAHIDARMGTPGASDNASGVIVLLLLAELLADYSGNLGIEMVAMNGEDYYSNPGEQRYLNVNAGKFHEIVLGINIDDVGYHKGKVAYSLYDCPSELADSIHVFFSDDQDLMIEGEPWYAGDHGLFLIQQRPALALTSERLAELMREFTHSPKDRPEIIDSAKLVQVAYALRDLLLNLDQDLT